MVKKEKLKNSFCLIRKCLWRSVQPSQRNKQNKSFFFYGVSKLAAENISELPRVFSDNYFKNFHCFWARSKNMLIPNIINKIQNDEEITC